MEQQQYYEVIDACFSDSEKRYWKKQEIITVFQEFGVKVTIPKLNAIMAQMSYDHELRLFASIGAVNIKEQWNQGLEKRTVLAVLDLNQSPPPHPPHPPPPQLLPQLEPQDDPPDEPSFFST